MPFDEASALAIAAVRAVESADRAPTVWTDADRAWASRAAAEVVGEGAPPESFLATRARLALDRLGERSKAVPRAVAALRWRPWVGVAIVAIAFVAGAAIDAVGGAQRINLLAPPLIGLLAWNLAVYVALAVGFVVRYGEAVPLGPLRRSVTWLAGGRAKSGRGELAGAVAQFANDWSRLSAPLYGARAARILHFAAAALAAGLVAGLYVRGVAFEYRATWESTFFEAPTVRAFIAAMLAPGAAVSGIAVPSVGEVEAIRAPAGENAARWLHLMAATALVIVVLPRLALALWAWAVERHRATHLPLGLDEPYFARLLRGFRGAPARVRVVPYSYAVPAAGAAGLERLIRAVFGANAALTIVPSVGYGGEDALAAEPISDSATSLIALFNATATPERETHGAFLDRLAAGLGPAGTLAALVDESALRDCWGDGAARLDARRASWRALCADRRVGCVFAALAAPDLSSPDLADAADALERVVEGSRS